MNDAEHLAKLEKKIDTLEAGMLHSSLMIAKNSEDTAEMLDMFKALKGGIKVLGWLGVAAKWAASIIAVFAAIYAIVQNIRGFK